MPKKKNNKKVSKKKKQEETLGWVTAGIVQVLIAVFSFEKIGWLGKQTANLVRLFFGDSYILASALLALFGLVMVIYGQPAHLKIKRSVGLCLTIFGILLIQSSLFFSQDQVNSAFMNAFWHEMIREFARANVTTSVGGGLLGTLGFQLLYPLLGQIGLKSIAIIMIPIGILMFFDVKYRTIIEKFQHFSQGFINKNKEAGDKLIDKYA